MRSAACLAVTAAVCLLVGCRFPTTVYGQLVVKPGDEGDVRLARVELHDSAAWDSASIYAVVPKPGGEFFRASFEFPEVVPGPYYLFAWQDRDGDGKTSDGDLVGFYRDTLDTAYPGKPVIVYESWTVDVADIEMATWTVLEVLAAGRRSQSRDTTTFTYAFNHDVFLSSLTVAFPGQPPLPDPAAPGPKAADSTYYSGGWRMGGTMPTGLHQLEFRGVFRDSTFSIRTAVLVE